MIIRIKNIVSILLAIFLTSINLYGQHEYSDRGHWLGMRVGYVPTGLSSGLAGVAMYEYRFDNLWSSQFDLSAIRSPNGGAFILGAAMRLRVPLGLMNKNIYGLVGFGSGSMYPVLYAGAGVEYGVTKRLSAVMQYRSYTSNFDYLAPTYGIYSVGVNFDITSLATNESNIMEDE